MGLTNEMLTDLEGQPINQLECYQEAVRLNPSNKKYITAMSRALPPGSSVVLPNGISVAGTPASGSFTQSQSQSGSGGGGGASDAATTLKMGLKVGKLVSNFI
eukprot:TRINITY_DN30516_c0_g1_i1.p1 TRINITY_DN30516_c0_g1~~TRINITY_DN30516_c0_g1_i1.p1  ORF type:complete len:103 (+),score=14.92 TRINITY_DN30516_c0_g1_i1:300-608(+)